MSMGGSRPIVYAETLYHMAFSFDDSMEYKKMVLTRHRFDWKNLHEIEALCNNVGGSIQHTCEFLNFYWGGPLQMAVFFEKREPDAEYEGDVVSHFNAAQRRILKQVWRILATHPYPKQMYVYVKRFKELQQFCQRSLALVQCNVAPYVIVDILNMLHSTSSGKWFADMARVKHVEKIRLAEAMQRENRKKSKEKTTTIKK